MRIRVIFSPVWLQEEALARLPTPLHLGRSVSRLPNCLNSRARVYRVMSDPPVITICVYIFGIPSYSSLRIDISRGWMSMRISRRESIRLPCSRDSSTRRGIERGAAPRRAERNSSSSSRDSQIPSAYTQTPQFAAVIF